MTQLKMDEQTARRLYPTAVPEFKAILEESFGKEKFSQKITDRVQGWQDILSISGVDPRTMQLRPGETDDELANRECKLISAVYNEGEILDAKNTNQRKWFVYGKVVEDSTKPSGLSLVFDVCDCWRTTSIVGVRLCFKELCLAIDAFNKFTSVYERAKIR